MVFVCGYIPFAFVVTNQILSGRLVMTVSTLNPWPQQLENTCISPVHIPHKAASPAREKIVASRARPSRNRGDRPKFKTESCSAGRCIRTRQPLRPPPPFLVRNRNSTRDLNGSTSNTIPSIPAGCCAARIPNSARTAKPKCSATSQDAKIQSAAPNATFRRRGQRIRRCII